MLWAAVRLWEPLAGMNIKDSCLWKVTAHMTALKKKAQCPGKDTLLVAASSHSLTFLILTSLKGAKPSIYFPGHLLQAGTSVLMQVDEAVGQGGVCVAKKGWRCSGDHWPGDAAGE